MPVMFAKICAAPVYAIALLLLCPGLGGRLALRAADQAAAVTITPADENIQSIIDSHPPGTVFTFEPGTYRLLSIKPKDGDHFVGKPGAIMNGSEQLNFQRANDMLWVATMHDTTPEAVGGVCDTGAKNADGTKYTIGCDHGRDLFWDNKVVWRVATLQEVAPGKWFFDPASHRVYVADDPEGHVVELGETQMAIHGNSSNIEISGLTIEKYANRPQSGAIACGEFVKGEQLHGPGWVIENNLLTLNHYSGLKMIQCSNARILNNKFFSNGNSGLDGVATDNSLMQGNEIALNNYARYSCGWECGGSKFVNTTNFTAKSNNVHDNLGPGLWFDIDCQEVTIVNNTIDKNYGSGILYEISRQATIDDNVVRLNGIVSRHFDPWAGEAQIEISASSDVTVEHNTAVVGNWGNGITVKQQNRGSGKFGPHWATRIVVDHNDITYLTPRSTTTGASEDTGKFYGPISFDYNTYHDAQGGNSAHWRWNAILNWAQFRKLGQEAHGTVDKAIPRADLALEATVPPG
jgi:parallel beta-helix repeat protein